MTLPTTQTVARPQAAGYGAAIGDLLVRLAVSPQAPLIVQTAQLQPARFETESTPEEVLQAFGDVYSLSSAVGGEGLIDRFRRGGVASDATRFWDSKGVDVSPTDDGQPDEIRLLKTTEEIDTLTGTGRMAHAGTTVWVTNGTQLRKTTDITATSPSWTDDDPHAGETPATTVEDVATLGDVPYVALGDNEIHRYVSAAWAQWSDVEAVRVWEARDRIIASDGASLYEADSGSSSSLLYTLPDGNEWTDCTPAGDVILASATNGYVYSFAPDDTGALTVIAQTLFKDEVPRALTARSNIVWIMASQGDELRLWQGRTAQGVITDLRLLKEWFECACGVLTATRDRVIAGVKESDGGYLWRVELETGGLSRAEKIGTDRVIDLAVVDGLTIATSFQEGTYRETDTFVEDGYIMSPLADFYRADEKSWVTAWADVLINSGERVELYYTTDRDAMFDVDSVSWVRVRSYTFSESGREIGLPDTVSRSLALMAKLYRSDSNTSPRVRSVSSRSYPGAGDVIVQLPVDVGDQIERFGKRRLRTNAWGQQVAEALRAREGQAVLCRVYRTGDVVRGLVESVATPTRAITPRGTVTQVAIVTVRGRRVPEIAPAFTLSGWGGFAWGAKSWGGGEP